MKTSGKISRYTAAVIATVLLHTGILFMPVVLPLRNTGTSSAEIVRTPPVTLFLTPASASAGTTVRVPAAGDSAGSAADSSGTGSRTLLSLLDKKIREQLVYPETARRRALEGTVTIRICINADGTLSTYRITAGSGSPTLDAAASKLIESVFPLPDGLSSVPVETTISIQYTLTQNLH